MEVKWVRCEEKLCSVALEMFLGLFISLPTSLALLKFHTKHP